MGVRAAGETCKGDFASFIGEETTRKLIYHNNNENEEVGYR